MGSEIPKICDLIGNCTKNKIKLTSEFGIKAKNRGYHPGQVKKIICKKKVVGVWEHEDGSFRVWFEKDVKPEHDTIIALRPLDNGEIKPITIYPRNKDKRLRIRE